jgi:hypothetical protein
LVLLLLCMDRVLCVVCIADPLYIINVPHHQPLNTPMGHSWIICNSAMSIVTPISRSTPRGSSFYTGNNNTNIIIMKNNINTTHVSDTNIHNAPPPPTSIMGVGTNFFPMSVDKVPKLQGMVTPFEMAHIEAFPSFLRLIIGGAFLPEIVSLSNEKLGSLQSVTFHRVIDNKKLTMDAANVWIQLNYQIMHLLDFIPVSNWGSQTNDTLFQNFQTLHHFLQRSQKLLCKLDFDLSSGETTAEGLPVTLGSVLDNFIPSAIKRRIGEKAIQTFSSKIGHSLEYHLDFGATAARL